MDTWLSRAIEQEAPTSKSMIKWWEHVTLRSSRVCLEDVLQIGNRELPEFDEFLKLWIDYLGDQRGLPYPLESGRVAVKTEPYPGRWTTHIVISKMSDLDEAVIAWVPPNERKDRSIETALWKYGNKCIGRASFYL